MPQSQSKDATTCVGNPDQYISQVTLALSVTHAGCDFAVRQLELKQMSMDDLKNGQRIKCNGVYGTVIGKRTTRNRRHVLVKMDNGFTLKLDPHTLSVGLPETGAIAQLKEPIRQLASVG